MSANKLTQTEEKKKLNAFLASMTRLGCVQGFRYFTVHLRGREELLCSVINEQGQPILLSAATSPSSSFIRDLTTPLLPQEPESFLIGEKRQRRLSGYGDINVGLPPASPASSQDETDDEATIFLIAAYARYGSPYVWVRTNHDRLVRLSEDATEKDYPLQLKSTSNWSTLVKELVHVCTCPSPINPFSVDVEYFESLPPMECLLASSAMLSMLTSIVTSGPHTYNSMVRSDMMRVSRVHFQAALECTAPPSSLSATMATPEDSSHELIKPSIHRLHQHYHADTPT